MEPPSRHDITITNDTDIRAPRTLIRRAIEAALDAHETTGEIDVMLTSDEEIRELNQKYRRVDEPTDVLSFPGGNYKGAPLGDIAISLDYAERQALARGASFSHEVAFLAIHGTLHLLGFEDETDEERLEMIQEMNRIARIVGIKPDAEWGSILHAEAS
jgi:probable rRNA maturation factor